MGVASLLFRFFFDLLVPVRDFEYMRDSVTAGFEGINALNPNLFARKVTCGANSAQAFYPTISLLQHLSLSTASESEGISLIYH